MPDRILLDTCVVLDVFLDSPEFGADARLLLEKCERQEIACCVSASAVTDMFYIARKQRGREVADKMIAIILETFGIVPVDFDVLKMAYGLGLSDFEDAVQATAARLSHIKTIVTRNLRDFKNSGLTVYAPKAFLKMLE